MDAYTPVINLLLRAADEYYHCNNHYLLISVIDSVLSDNKYAGRLEQLPDYLQIIDILKDKCTPSPVDKIKEASRLYSSRIVGRSY